MTQPTPGPHDPAPRHPIVPPALLAGFADAAGQVLLERRDRLRRRRVPVAEAAGEMGAYRVAEGPGAAGLARLLAGGEEAADAARERLVAGAFPPPPADRAALALWIALRLRLGRGARARLAEVAAGLALAIEEGLRDAAGEDRPAGDDPAPGPAAGADVLVDDGDGAEGAVSLAGLPRLARLLAGRTWQLARFPGRVLLTGDTPAVLWVRPSSGAGPPTGPAAAEEVRVPLGPAHALILARSARLGEVVRDLDERHARALNRTVAEAAHTWMCYHPESDPLLGVELTRP
jgi:hypothetical protein